MNAYQLRENYYKHNPNGHFFDRDTLRFFGERMSEMRVFKNTTIITDRRGNSVECYILSTYQHKAPNPCRVYHYFDVNTFDQVVL